MSISLSLDQHIVLVDEYIVLFGSIVLSRERTFLLVVLSLLFINEYIVILAMSMIIAECN